MLAVIDGYNGKTNVAAELIRTLADGHWSTLKISGGLLGLPATPRIHEESVANARTDTGRMLAAGAERSFEVFSPDGNLEQLLPDIERVLASAHNAIIETSAVLRVVNADLYLYVIDIGAPGWRERATEALDRVDAFIAVDRDCRGEDIPSSIEGRPVLHVCPDRWLSPELSALVQSKMAARTV